MLTNKKISVIAICYNDGGCVREMYRRVTEIMAQITPNYEIIYVNDASPDNALDILRELAANDKRLIVINHARNFGGQNAYAHGLAYCTGDAAITLDGDIQDPPEMFPDMVKKWLEGYDVVYGIRQKREGVSFFYQCAYKVFYRVMKKLASMRSPVDASDFALVDRKVINALTAMPENFRFYRSMRAWVGFKQIGLPYVRLPRFHGYSSNNFWRNVWWARKAVYDFSEKPLDYVFYASLWMWAVFGLSIVALIAVLMFNLNVSLIILGFVPFILLLAAIQLTAVTIVGEYVTHIFQEVKRRSHYITAEIINDYKGDSFIQK